MVKLSTKDKIINASIELITRRGFNATTVDDIVKHAGVAKGSVYHAFKSKDALAIAALEEYLHQGLSMISDGPIEVIDDPVERALAFMDFLEGQSKELWARGSMLGSLAIEVGDSYPAVNEQIDRMFKRFEKTLADIFSPALAKKQVVGTTSRDLSIHLVAVIEGSIIAAKAHSEPQYLQHGIRHFRHYLEFILSK